MGRQRLFDKKQILVALHSFMAERGMPPTVEELRQALGLGSTRTVLRYLRWLEEDGVIERWRGARGIRLLKAPESVLETISVPVVGEAPAGALMVAEENIEGWVRVPQQFTRPQSATFFLLRVRGDSMNRATVAGERIEDGDLVLVRQHTTADSGQVVVALADGQATIKRFARGPSYHVLKPESTNSAHQPIVVDQTFAIQGIVCRVLKKGSELLHALWNER